MFCGEKIQRVIYQNPVYDGRMQYDWENPEALTYDGKLISGNEYWVSYDTVERWRNEVLYENIWIKLENAAKFRVGYIDVVNAFCWWQI